MESYVERPPLPVLAGVVRGSSVDRLEEAMARAETPQRAVVALQALLLREFRSAVRVDPLVRELTGLTPRQLLGGSVDRCACGHEHSASYKPFLATRSRPPLRA
jgi:hypothetical protein